MGQVAKVFLCVIEIGFNPLDKIQLSLSYLGNFLNKLTSQRIRNFGLDWIGLDCDLGEPV